MKLFDPYIESMFLHNYVINKSTLLIMDELFHSDPFIRNNTLILKSINKKLKVINNVPNCQHIKTMFIDYIKEYTCDIPQIYIIISPGGSNIKKYMYSYNYLPFFYLSMPIDMHEGLILPDYNLPRVKFMKAGIYKTDIYSQCEFIRLFSYEDDININVIVQEIRPKKEWLLLDQMFIPGVDYIISDDMTNYVPGSGINKYKNLTNKNILKVLHKIIQKYIKYNLHYEDAIIINEGKILGNGYYGNVYEISNDKNKIIKHLTHNKPRIYNTYHDILFSSILADNPLFLKTYNIYLANNMINIIIEKADYTLLDYYTKYSMTKKTWKKLYTDIYTALQEMHRLNICHGDISPRNIMYSIKHDKFFLIDFGSSSWLTSIKKVADLKKFSSIPDRLREDEVINKYDIDYIIKTAPPDVSDKWRIVCEPHEFLSDEHLTKVLWHFAALYYIRKHDLYGHTYPNKLFTNII